MAMILAERKQSSGERSGSGSGWDLRVHQLGDRPSQWHGHPYPWLDDQRVIRDDAWWTLDRVCPVLLWQDLNRTAMSTLWGALRGGA